MAKIGKAEAARILGVSERTLERNVKSGKWRLTVKDAPGRTKRVPQYDEDEIKLLARDLNAPRSYSVPVEPPAPSGTVVPVSTIPTTGDNTGAAVGILSSMLAGGLPFWTSYDDAVSRTGAAKSWIQAGVWGGAIASFGGRVRLLDVLLFVNSPRLPEVVAEWRERERKPQPKQLRGRQ